MMRLTGKNRVFLFLQGPHGPYFSKLGKMLRKADAEVWRVGFNAGDQFFWRDRRSYIPYRGTIEDWPKVFCELLVSKKVTDIVLYGDTRPVHAAAIAAARNAGLRIHVFEEGYLRPYWVTYERDGSNGHSRLMDMRVQDMRVALESTDQDDPLPPANWGDMRQHIFYGALYHGFVMFANARYRNFQPHRAISVTQEFKLYLRRLVLMPIHFVDRQIATRRIRSGGFPYHLALLQLEHDSSFVMHSNFNTMVEYLELVIEGFTKGAPSHHHLVIKAHPLEDGRIPIRRELKRLVHEFGIQERVHYVRGGKLAQLLDEAKSTVTVNSTAAQQALWRGIPVKAFGDAVYAKPEFVSDRSLPDFFSNAQRPDHKAYKDFRRYLLETSQIAGGYYSAQGRRQLLRKIVDKMLIADDPYDALKSGTEAPRQQLRAIT